MRRHRSIVVESERHRAGIAGARDSHAWFVREALGGCGCAPRVLLDHIDMKTRLEQRRDVPTATYPDHQHATTSRQPLGKRHDERMWRLSSPDSVGAPKFA